MISTPSDIKLSPEFSFKMFHRKFEVYLKIENLSDNQKTYTVKSLLELTETKHMVTRFEYYRTEDNAPLSKVIKFIKMQIKRQSARPYEKWVNDDSAMNMAYFTSESDIKRFLTLWNNKAWEKVFMHFKVRAEKEKEIGNNGTGHVAGWMFPLQEEKVDELPLYLILLYDPTVAQYTKKQQGEGIIELEADISSLTPRKASEGEGRQKDTKDINTYN